MPIGGGRKTGSIGKAGSGKGWIGSDKFGHGAGDSMGPGVGHASYKSRSKYTLQYPNTTTTSSSTSSTISTTSSTSSTAPPL